MYNSSCHTGGILSIQLTACYNLHSGAVLRWGRGGGHLPPHSPAAPPQMQKLADRSDVISEVPKMLLNPNFLWARTWLRELTALPQTRKLMGEGARCPCQGALVMSTDMLRRLINCRFIIIIIKNPTPLSALRASFLQVSWSNPLQS